MKVYLALLLLGITLVAATTDSVREQFIGFQHKYSKFYSTKAEFDYRLAVFEQNLKNAEVLTANAGGQTVFGVTQFMDLTTEEFKNTVLMSKLPPRRDPKLGPYHNETLPQAPSSFDWRTHHGVVTPIYNQGDCGSCWAFSATEDIESQWALSGKRLTRLSMQQIVSCDRTDYGCDGGWPYHAYAYVAGAGGQDSYASYPYTGTDSPCAFKKADIVAKLDTSRSWSYVTQSRNEAEMASYLAQHGPISVCVDAASWQYYSSGVFMASSCGTSIDHCVDAVGYDTAANPPYWIIRNSWGTNWGQNGYMHLQYGKDSCAVAQVVTNAHAA